MVARSRMDVEYHFKGEGSSGCGAYMARSDLISIYI